MSEARSAARQTAPQSRRQTAEQERAREALQRVREVKGKAFEARYTAEVKGLPAMILINGLGQTLAFLRAKGKDAEHAALYAHVATWVSRQLKLDGDLLEAITQIDVATYRRCQVEALALLTWLKRFAEAELTGEEAP